MCGIAGFFSAKHKFTEGDLHAMTTCLAHRGPDAAGYYTNLSGSLGFGHRRLSILDLSTAANQPMTSHNGRYIIAFNGEVYNFQEIAAKLNIITKTTSDTEVILEAFLLKGVEAVQLFNGMFAIAIYDTLQDELYLFRDRLGVKPIYYYFKDGVFAFASELKALLSSDYIKGNIEVNKAVIPTYLNVGYVPEPHTIYTHIYRQPAGSVATVINGEMTIKNYWTPEEKIKPAVVSDFAGAKKELKSLLETSVKYRMISDVPFGTFLSGGIDSSTVTAIAQKVSEKPVKTFSIGFKEATHNESEFARDVANKLGTQHTEFIVSETDALALIDRMLTAYDEPYTDSSAIPTMLVSKLARQHVTMVLTGDGGDELFHGYGAYTWAKRLDKGLVKGLRKPLAFALSMMGERFKRGSEVINYADEARIKSHIFSQEQYLFSTRELDALLVPSFTRSILLEETFHGLERKLSAAEEQALFDIKYYLKDDLLVKVDKASMQFSLEARSPFLDYRIVEFALNLDEKLKIHNGTAKYLLKEVLYDYLPRETFNRPKWGFSIPLGKWLKNELNYLLKDYLNKDVIEQCGVVQFEAVETLLNRFYAGENYLYNRLWALVVLHKWIKEVKI